LQTLNLCRYAEAEKAKALVESIAAREAAVSEREAAIAAAGHELASQCAVFERGRDDADRRWADLEVGGCVQVKSSWPPRA
jgi:hypothetical protein